MNVGLPKRSSSSVNSCNVFAADLIPVAIRATVATSKLCQSSSPCPSFSSRSLRTDNSNGRVATMTHWIVKFISNDGEANRTVSQGAPGDILT